VSRRHTKNVANYESSGKTATSNVIGAHLAGSGQIAAHAWAWYNTISATNNGNRLFNVTGSAGAGTTYLGVATDASSHLQGLARSKSSDALQAANGTTTLPTKTWVSVGIMVDYAAATINVYLNGKLEISGAGTFGQTTLATPSSTWPDAIGGDTNASTGAPTGTNIQLDGFIAEVGFWRANLLAGDFMQLAQGAQATQVRAEGLRLYWPLRGINSPEIDIVSGHMLFATGTIDPCPNFHPPIQTKPRPRRVGQSSGAYVATSMYPAVMGSCLPRPAELMFYGDYV
jgi:hypothetical protein